MTPPDIPLAWSVREPTFRSTSLGRGNGATGRSHRPDRVWLHTCDLDHPAALPNYLKAGFEIYDTKVIEQPLEATPIEESES